MVMIALGRGTGGKTFARERPCTLTVSIGKGFVQSSSTRLLPFGRARLEQDVLISHRFTGDIPCDCMLIQPGLSQQDPPYRPPPWQRWEVITRDIGAPGSGRASWKRLHHLILFSGPELLKLSSSYPEEGLHPQVCFETLAGVHITLGRDG